VAASQEIGISLKASRPKDALIDGQILIWEARGGGDTEITPELASRIGQCIQHGGCLLLTLSENPGAGPMRLSFMLPTTAWHTQAQAASAARLAGGGIIVQTDPTLFPNGDGINLKLPWFYPLRPFDAVERGEGRYERFARTIPYIDLPVAPGNSFWTRPLINRDWQIAARAGDLAHTPVLLTGRYGAGRVAIFASSLASPQTDTQAFWKDTLRWLSTDDAATNPPSSSPTVELPEPQWEVGAEHRLLRVTVRNPQSTDQHVRVLARLRTWEAAIVGDVEKELSIPAHGNAVAELALPKPDATAYQALEFRDAFDVRLGVLAADGATLLHETRLPVDLRPPVLLSVATDNLRNIEYPFHAPGPQSATFPHRLGMEIGSYAYKPGQKLNATVTIANGIRNIAPLAQVRDETNPDNVSLTAINDDAGFAEQQGSPDKVEGRGTWVGAEGRENTIRFSFASPVTIVGVTLIGSPDNFRNYLVHNPGAVIVEADDHEIARATDLDQRFTTDAGTVRLTFPAVQARTLRVRLPWVDKLAGEGARKRSVPWLAEVCIEGSTSALPAAQHGKLSVTLRDVLSNQSTPIAQQELDLTPGQAQRINFAATVPAEKSTRFYRIEASFLGQESSAPVMAIDPAHPLLPLADLKPPTAPDLGFIVTRGFRNVFDIGTGTQEMTDSWGTPDDLIWAYSHQMKQLGRKTVTRADRLFVTDSDMRHYSTPWRSFPDGEYFYDIAPRLLVDRLKQDSRWANSSVALLSHSDRWDTSPDVDALNGWQDFIDFDDYLRHSGRPGLQGRTHKELAEEIRTKYDHPWHAWHLSRYVHAVRNLREAFAKEGKTVVITAQGSPLVPGKAEADLTQTIRGQSDDCTWGMIEESTPLTTGRQMGVMAFNPGWAMSTLLQWGYNSGVLNNPHWHNPVGTTEPSRRNLYDRAWRGVVGRDGVYHSMHTYGYNLNAGDSYTMTENDWQQWFRVEERCSLIAPEGPIGAGVVISTARFDDPDRASFSGSGGSGASEADEQARAVAKTVRRLHDAGVSVPFSTNAAVLDKWTGTAPLVLLDIDLFSDAELASVRQLRDRGVRIVASVSDAAVILSKPLQELFGVTVNQIGDIKFVQSPTTLLVESPLENLTASQAQPLMPLIKKQLDLPLEFPDGTSGYGFTSQGLNYIVLEDWLEQGRTVTVKFRGTTGTTAATAVDVNDHRPLNIRRQGPDWLIEVPLRPGDGTLIAVKEEGK
jgi:hypothetical protein